MGCAAATGDVGIHRRAIIPLRDTSPDRNQNSDPKVYPNTREYYWTAEESEFVCENRGRTVATMICRRLILDFFFRKIFYMPRSFVLSLGYFNA